MPAREPVTVGAVRVKGALPKVFVAIEKEEREVVALEIVMVKESVVAVAVLLSVTRMVIAEEPADVGVPEMVPAELKDRPAGREPERSVKVSLPDPPEALRVSE